MTFTERGWRTNPVITSVSAWDFKTIAAAVTSADKIRIKNIMIQGVYEIDQTTEVNTQYGLIGLCMMRFPDTVSTPDPDFLEASSSSGLDRQIFKWRYVWASGQNNPVLWTMKFKAINCNPGQKVILGTRVLVESGTSLNHRVHIAGRHWQDDG